MMTSQSSRFQFIDAKRISPSFISIDFAANLDSALGAALVSNPDAALSSRIPAPLGYKNLGFELESGDGRSQFKRRPQ
ncbi:hypothetical protein EVAR_93538_1 [Eumeta japonica]|uniref:Uncharacterized protein n=1 Tax=Eumeta variegata TaxID=151549 RepID=A0A4C1USV0_EUMVA|nr:hypothetical protein EVAR_93538_1 [Eumeta japonica]